MMRVGLTAAVTVLFLSSHPAAASTLDLGKATIVTPADLTGPARRAVDLLVTEIERRSQVRLPIATKWPTTPGPVIAVGLRAGLTAFAGPHLARMRDLGTSAPPEGFRIRIERSGRAAVYVIGNDSRGLLFGVGRLLRALTLSPGRISTPAQLDVLTAPNLRLRGHVLPWTSAPHAGWSAARWRQHLVDLVLFGANAVELPFAPQAPRQTLTTIAQTADELGLSVWVRYPPLPPGRPDAVTAALDEWATALDGLPRVDAVLIDGGTPTAALPARAIPGLMETHAARLRRTRASLAVWVAPPAFPPEEGRDFYVHFREREPQWVTGFVHLPGMRSPPALLRKRIPRRYPVRLTPEVALTMGGPFPVQDWDPTFAITQGPRPVSPRPLAMAHMFRLLRDSFDGVMTAGEGLGDDVNRLLWTALAWDSAAEPTEILRQYARLFAGPALADPLAQGLFALERNWRGPLLTNEEIYRTLRQFQGMEQLAPGLAKAPDGWRFRGALRRAYQDAHLRARIVHDTAVEERALDRLRHAPTKGALAAIAEAEAVFGSSDADAPGDLWRARVAELADADPDPGRPTAETSALNDRRWWLARLAEIRKLTDERKRIAALQDLLGWTDPGPGGFYDDLGNPVAQPHLARGPGLSADPTSVESALMGVAGLDRDLPRSQWTFAETRHETPLELHYAELDPRARYAVRVVYGGDDIGTRVRLTADERQIHPYLQTRFERLEFELPVDLTRDGRLTLTFSREAGAGDRGPRVAEVWLIRK